MQSSEQRSPPPQKTSNTLFKSIAPVTLRDTSSTKPQPLVKAKRQPTPDPSPVMNPMDVQGSSTKSGSSFAVSSASSSSPGLRSEQPAPSGKAVCLRRKTLLCPAGRIGFLPFPVVTALIRLASLSMLASSSNARPVHSLYPSATPPLSPAHALLSPAANPHYSNSADPSQQSSAFYQLPPPLQSFRSHDAVHHSPTLPPQYYHQGHGGVLPPFSVPRTPQGLGSEGSSPRSIPRQSPHMHHPVSSPSIGPLSPYPTPQHHPQHQSSPHQSPRFEGQQTKHQMPPTMALPASMSSTSVFQVLPLRPHSAHYPANHLAKNGPHGTHLKSAQNSAPKSPQRFMMLPPQTAPTMSSTRQSGSQSKTATGVSPKRRSSSNAKAVDQETREKLRKVSHSAIERRRRERINDKILQLKYLVPACVDEDHLHKLSILQSTIEYIQYLKSVIPESVANATLKKATNDNPNNKTTDMLVALTGPSAGPSFAPMMTTGLGQPYQKRPRLDNESDSSQQNRSAACLPDTPHKDKRRLSMPPSTSDEDAKDGLLLLSQLSSGHLSASVSPTLAPRPGASQGKRASKSESTTCEGRREAVDEEDEDVLQDDSEASDELDDEDYRDEAVEEERMSDDSQGDASRRSSKKMSVMQMLC
ncbi:unnamed protein product [Mortierella alpina]